MLKCRGRELTEEEKLTNRVLSSARVGVEHVIGHLKFNRIYADKVRYRLPLHDILSNVICGMYNMKLEV